MVKIFVGIRHLKKKNLGPQKKMFSFRFYEMAFIFHYLFYMRAYDNPYRKLYVL